jgi:hypothetical protein
MLEARDVLWTVCDYLEKEERYEIGDRRSPNGTVIAKHPEKGRLLINAYGEKFKSVSQRDRAQRAGEDRAMNELETWDCVSRALHGAGCRLYSEMLGEGDRVVLCFPHTHSFWKYLRPLKGALEQLGVTVFLVRGDNSVVTL